MKIILSLWVCLMVNACSSTTHPLDPSTKTAKIVQIKQIKKPQFSQSERGYLGIDLRSGGQIGLYGSFDLMDIFKQPTNTKYKPEAKLEVIARKPTGELIVVTEPLTSQLKVGDRVKIIRRKGRIILEH
ncbi:MAG: hypothetical protein KAG28_10065 [Cocleimonas sp.]|nr:hypothetical protein [Cocleimonas sp.]